MIFTHVYTPSGGVTFGGSGSLRKSALVAYAPSGGVTFGGAAIYTTVAATPPSGLSFETWTMNLESHAHSRYSNYAFSGFAKFGTTYYGVQSSGLFTLGGDTDNTAPIRSSVYFPESDFENHHGKRVGRLYIGAMAATALNFKAVAEAGVTYYYTVSPSTSAVAGARVQIGRGLVSRYWQFGVFNTNGGYFELATMKLYPIVLNRVEM